jgi:hypothetical protein
VSDQRRAYQSVVHCARSTKKERRKTWVGLRISGLSLIFSPSLAPSLSLSPSAYPVERNEIIFYTLHAICFYFSSPRTSIGIVILKKLFLRAGLCNRFRRSLRPLRPTSYWQSFRLHVAGNRLPLITAICSFSRSPAEALKLYVYSAQIFIHDASCLSERWKFKCNPRRTLQKEL